jgi:serpin B
VELELNPQHVRTVKDVFGGEAQTLSFGQVEPARQHINDWVEDATKGKVEDLIPPGGIDSRMLLVLANAAHFRAAWEHPFDTEVTMDKPFYPAPSKEVTVATMRQRGSFAVGTGKLGGKAMRSVSLPYLGGAFSLLIALPEHAAASLPKRFEPGELAALVARQKPRFVELELPRVTLAPARSLELVGAIRSLGARELFSPRADLSGIGGESGGLRVSAIFHKGRLDIDEAGTIGGAAAGAVVQRSVPHLLQIDRPFLFAITDTRNGAVLFMGRVVDPRQKH